VSSEWVLETAPPQATARIKYGDDASQFGDLRLPKDPRGFKSLLPVVVNIHGGFWRAAYDLTHAGHLCQAITDLGFATWNIEYRRIGNGGGYPNTFIDVVNAVNHLRVIAPQYNLDLDRVIVMGHSAGGHLASWVGAIVEARHGASLQIKPLTIISSAGVLDLKRAFELGLSNNVVKDFLGGTPEEVPERYAASSPIQLLPCGTKQILIHGEGDDIVPFEIAQRYYDAAKAKGDDVKLIPLKGMGHFEVIDPKSAAWDTVRDLIKFYLHRTHE
jgi:acetyl esterase/lipase